MVTSFRNLDRNLELRGSRLVIRYVVHNKDFLVTGAAGRDRHQNSRRAERALDGWLHTFTRKGGMS